MWFCASMYVVTFSIDGQKLNRRMAFAIHQYVRGIFGLGKYLTDVRVALVFLQRVRSCLTQLMMLC
jgi:hypothetical protein